MDAIRHRRNVLLQFGASDQEAEELLTYNANVFRKPDPAQFPLEDEPFVAAWRTYAAEAKTVGVFAALKDKMVQLHFPIQEGISATAAYRDATRRGADPKGMPAATGLSLNDPESLELIIHPTPAGHLPVILVRDRSDFAALVRALARRNEPAPVPDAVGACMISGYNNWDRLRQWKTVFQGLPADKALYQDRLMIVSDGPYSGVQAAELQLSEQEWRRLSLLIRLEHEAVHYFTRRVLGAMRNHMMDELIADFIGISSALGTFKAAWFLRFVGLENFPGCRADGRIHSYRGDLSDGAFVILQKLLVEAARRLEAWSRHFQIKAQTAQEKAHLIQTLAAFTLDELASPEGYARLVRETGKNLE